MNQLTYFQDLKNDVLLMYKKHYPYYEGNWKNFSSQDIRNLIDSIETNVKQSISEKWVYTHLKSENNHKLPRKDMLDILSKWVGFSGWDEYIFEKKKQTIGEEQPALPSKKKFIKWTILALIIVLLSTAMYYKTKRQEETIHRIELKESYSSKKLIDEDFQVTKEVDSQSIPVQLKDGKIELNIKDTMKITIKSPFYEDKTIVLNASNSTKEIVLEPNDYALMLKAFMKSDIKDWQTRKRQLQVIIADDAEIIVMLENNLGAEYFNKEEFIQKIIVPSPSVQKMKIVAIENNRNQQMKFIRIIQN